MMIVVRSFLLHHISIKHQITTCFRPSPSVANCITSQLSIKSQRRVGVVTEILNCITSQLSIKSQPLPSVGMQRSDCITSQLSIKSQRQSHTSRPRANCITSQLSIKSQPTVVDSISEGIASHLN